MTELFQHHSEKQIEFHQEKEQQQADFFAPQLDKKQTQAAEKINRKIERNFTLLTTKIKPIADDDEAINNLQTSTLENIEKRKETAGFKERRILKKDQAFIQKEGVVKFREKVKSSLHQVLDKTLDTKEKTTLQDDGYSKSVSRMQATMASDYTTGKEEKEALFDKLLTTEKAATLMERRSLQLGVVAKKLRSGMGEHAVGYYNKKI